MTVRHESELVLFGHPLRVWSYKLKPDKPHSIGEVGFDYFSPKTTYNEIEVVLDTPDAGVIRLAEFEKGERTGRIHIKEHFFCEEVNRTVYEKGNSRIAYRERLVWEETKKTT